MKLALVHDWLNTLGGAERVLIELHRIFPDAPIYTLFYNKKFKSKYLSDAEVRSSFLQKLPFINKYYKYTAILMPSAIESFDLSDFDLVLSSSVFFSKGLILRPKTRHICYCYSPTRQLWDLHQIQNSKIIRQSIRLPLRIDGERLVVNGVESIGEKIIKHFLRIWDRQAADRVDEFVAISETVRSRIQKYYRRDAKVIYPPVGLEPGNQVKINRDSRFKIRDSKFYLIVSRLYPHKNIDIAIETFNKTGLPLIIIGTGSEYKNLKSKILNPKSIQMIGFVPDEELSYYYQNCRAFIMPQEEDFGLTPLEAMLFGKPVLALRKGGALETLLEGITGEFFDDPIPEALADGIRRLNENYHNYRPDIIKAHANQFSTEIFKKEIEDLLKFR